MFRLSAKSTWMSTTSGAMATAATSTDQWTKWPNAILPVGLCGTPTTTTWASWRRVVWVCWYVPRDVSYQMGTRFTFDPPFVIRLVGSNRARPARIVFVSVAYWRFNHAEATVATLWRISGAIHRMLYFSKPKGCMITPARNRNRPARRGRFWASADGNVFSKQFNQKFQR